MQADYVILGAGPTGCTIGILLARAGRDVLLLDRESPAMIQVGESLLPSCGEVFDELGIDMSGFLEKHGVVFTDKGRSARYPFNEALRTDRVVAWQTPRNELDERMRKVALEAGCRFQCCNVTDVELPVVQTDQGPVTANKLFIDAGGRSQFLARKFGTRRGHPLLKNGAITAWFTGVKPQPPEVEGDIAACRYEGGWFWFIPFADGRWSVGTTISKGGPSGANRFEKAVALCPEAAVRLEGAEQVQPFRGAADISASAEKFYGEGWVMAGDAATFLDPIFSSGVTLGLHSGRSLARTILASDTAEALATGLERWEQELRDAVKAFEPVVLSYYEGKFLDLTFVDRSKQQETVRKAIISLLAGDVFDPEFDAPRRFGKRLDSIHRMVIGT